MALVKKWYLVAYALEGGKESCFPMHIYITHIRIEEARNDSTLPKLLSVMSTSQRERHSGTWSFDLGFILILILILILVLVLFLFERLFNVRD
jgi:hypothetical protein